MTTQAIQPALSQAIKEATETRLRLVLTAILEQNPQAASTAASLLLVSEAAATKDQKPQTTSTRENPPPKKRKRYEVCIQCDEEYDVSKNNDPTACQWHPGSLEPDLESDVWADHDVDCHGPYEDAVDDVPEGFIWTCCNRFGDDDEFCEVGVHRAKP